MGLVHTRKGARVSLYEKERGYVTFEVDVIEESGVIALSMHDVTSLHVELSRDETRALIDALIRGLGGSNE